MVLDIERSLFYIVIPLLITGYTLHFIIQRYEFKRLTFKFGIWSLLIILGLLPLLFYNFPLSITSLTIYLFLCIGETLCIPSQRKTNPKTETYLIGIVILINLLFYIFALKYSPSMYINIINITAIIIIIYLIQIRHLRIYMVSLLFIFIINNFFFYRIFKPPQDILKTKVYNLLKRYYPSCQYCFNIQKTTLKFYLLIFFLPNY